MNFDPDDSVLSLPFGRIKCFHIPVGCRFDRFIRISAVGKGQGSVEFLKIFENIESEYLGIE